MDWHAEYVNLGRAAALCDCAPLDANYNASTHTFTPKIAVPRAYFTGEGRSQGVALTLVTASGSASRPVRTFHRDSWSDTVYDWQRPDAARRCCRCRIPIGRWRLWLVALSVTGASRCRTGIAL